MSAASTRLPPGEGALGGEVVGHQVPGRDRRAETRVPRSARRAHLEHLAALPAEAEAHVALRLLDRVSHAGAAAVQLRAVAQVERSEGRAALDPFALRGAVDGRPTAGDELLETLGALAPGDRIPAAERVAHLDRGAVATTTIVGARAAAHGLFPLRGVTTEGPRGEGLSLPAASALVFGGWEVRAGSLLDAAADLAESGRIFDGRLLDPLAVDLDEIDQDIVRGGTRGVPPPCGAVEAPAEVIEHLAGDLRAFRRRHFLERVVVVNLATTEP